MLLPEVHEDELPELYAWIDTIPLSKPKKSIARDFADGVCMAELIHTFFPRLVELHNYSPASNTAQKFYNWQTLNARVFQRLGFKLPKEMLEAAATAEPGVVERILKLARDKMVAVQERRSQQHVRAQGHFDHPPPHVDSGRHTTTSERVNTSNVGAPLSGPPMTAHYDMQPAGAVRPESALLMLAQPGVHPPDVSASWYPAHGSVAASTEFALHHHPPSSGRPSSPRGEEYAQQQHQEWASPVRPTAPVPSFSEHSPSFALPLVGTAQLNVTRGGEDGSTGIGNVNDNGGRVGRQYENEGGKSMQSDGTVSFMAGRLAALEACELREMNGILELKVQKLEQLLRLKDAKIAALGAQLEAATGRPPL